LNIVDCQFYISWPGVIATIKLPLRRTLVLSVCHAAKDNKNYPEGIPLRLDDEYFASLSAGSASQQQLSSPDSYQDVKEDLKNLFIHNMLK